MLKFHEETSPSFSNYDVLNLVILTAPILLPFIFFWLIIFLPPSKGSFVMEKNTGALAQFNIDLSKTNATVQSVQGARNAGYSQQGVVQAESLSSTFFSRYYSVLFGFLSE